MAGAGTKAGGLSEADLQTMRDSLAAGRRPKVVFTDSAGQIAGQLGQVVSLEDPGACDEWVVVKFGRDELPFAPGDLRPAPKGATAASVRKAAAPPPPPPPARPEPEFVIDKPVVAPARRTGSGGATGQAAAMTESPAADATPVAPAPRKAARAPKPKAPPGLTVTLAYGEGEWTVAASQGAKTLARPYVIKPAEAMRMVSLVDVPGVQEAVEQILSAERADAEQQAQRLRAQLAEVESRLAELRDAG